MCPGIAERKPGCFSSGSSSAPNGERKNGCGGLGIISMLVGTQGGFLVYLGVQQCAPAPEQGYSFPAGQEGESRCLLLGLSPASVKGSPCSALPSGFSMPIPEGCSRHTGLSLMDFWSPTGFLLRVWPSHSVSPITCRAGCPRAGGSLRIPASVSLPTCSWCSGSRGAAMRTSPHGAESISRTPCSVLPLNFHHQIISYNRANVPL